MTIAYSSHKVGSAEGVNQIAFSHSVVRGEKVLLFVASLRAGTASGQEDYTISAFHGSTAMTLLGAHGYVSNNRGYQIAVFSLSIASGGSIGQTGLIPFTINFSKSVNSASYGLVAYSGIASFGRVTIDDLDGGANSITVTNTTSTLGQFVGMVAPRVNGGLLPSVSYTSPAAEIGVVTTDTGTVNADQALSIAHFGGVSPGNYSLSWSSPDGDPVGAALVEAIPASVFDPIGGIGGTQSNSPFSGRIGGVGGVVLPTVIVGSIPPTQVNWLGNIGLHTREETIYVAVALTYDDLWAQPDSTLAAVQALGVRVKRRKGYLFPR